MKEEEGEFKEIRVLGVTHILCRVTGLGVTLGDEKVVVALEAAQFSAESSDFLLQVAPLYKFL